MAPSKELRQYFGSPSPMLERIICNVEDTEDELRRLKIERDGWIRLEKQSKHLDDLQPLSEEVLGRLTE